MPLKELVEKPDLGALGMSLRQFASLPETCTAVFSSLMDCEVQPPDGGNTEKDVSVYGVSGRFRVTPERFASLDDATAPDFVVAPADVQSAHVSRKRQGKSVDRTLNFLDTVRDTVASPEARVFGALVGGVDIECRVRCAEETAARPTAGFFIEGLDGGVGRTAQAAVLEAVIPLLPDDKPRGMRCNGHPVEILDLVSRGIDLFDSAYPFIAAESGEALMFAFGADEEDPGLNDAPDASGAGALCVSLWDAGFKADFSPLNDKTPYTRAYVHHLLVTHEMLATVALTAHNVAVYLRFFNDIRQSIRAGTFETLRADFLARYTAKVDGPT